MTIMKNADTTKSIARSTAMMSALTLISRVTGFIRTWAMAFALGNTILAASFSLANNLPNMIYELVAGGVLSTAFLPIYLQQRNMRSREEGNRYASNLLSLAFIFLGVIALLASIFSPQVMLTQTLFSSSSSSSETVENAVWLFRFFAFQIVFYGVSAIFGGLLNAEREYFWPSISSVFMNLIIIVTFFAYPFVSSLSSQAGLLLLAIGTTLSIAVMACVQIPALVKAGFRFRFHIDLHDEGLHETVRLAFPAILCTAINLVSLSFMNSCALHVAPNGPASISYAWMWYQFPYGVLGVALSTALFTEMSDRMSHGDVYGFKQHLNMGLRTTCLLIIPMAAMLFVCSDELSTRPVSSRPPISRPSPTCCAVGRSRCPSTRAICSSIAPTRPSRTSRRSPSAISCSPACKSYSTCSSPASSPYLALARSDSWASHAATSSSTASCLLCFLSS